jgi:hypothetical protein
VTGRRCVYTVVAGGYEPVLEQHIARQHDTDLICFTDGEVPAGSGWQARPLELVLPQDTNRSSRLPKLLPHRVLPDYDESLYIDNNVLLTVDPAVMFERFLPDGVGMAAFAHSFRATLRDEFEEVVKVGKEAAWVCEEQLHHYEATDPEALDMRPIIGGFLFRRHADPLVQATMERWWVHVLRYSRRDQLSLLVVARELGLDILVHEVDNHLSEWHEWPRGPRRDPGGGSPLAPGPEVRIAELEAEVAHLHQAIGSLHEQVHAANEQAVRDLESVRAEYEASTSWRLTRPIRAVKDRLGGRNGPPDA